MTAWRWKVETVVASLILVIGVLVIVIFVVAGVSPSNGSSSTLPAGHHEDYDDYLWTVIVNSSGGYAQFYTDTQPTFSIGESGEETGQIVCTIDARESLYKKDDNFFIGGQPYCVGGETLRVIPQGFKLEN